MTHFIQRPASTRKGHTEAMCPIEAKNRYIPDTIACTNYKRDLIDK